MTGYILMRFSPCFLYTDRAAEQLEYLFKNIWQSLVSRQKPVKGPGKGSMLKKLNK